MHVENAMRDYMLHRGVTLFWVDSAVNAIRQGLATNAYLVTNVLTQRLTVKDGHVSTYTATVMAHYPDRGARQDVPMTLRYTFRPQRRKAHRLTVQAVAGDGTA